MEDEDNRAKVEDGPPPPLPSGGKKMRWPSSAGAADMCCRLTAVCLGILCVLLLGLSIGLAIQLTGRDQLLTDQSNLLKERDQLLTNHSSLLKERDQLLTNHSSLFKERDQLLTNHSSLLKERDQLMRYKLREESMCSPGWVVFRCNCYHNDASSRSWSDARKYCQSLGGDLVITQTPEKLRFLHKMWYAGWIGLKKDSGSWRWIDDTPVSIWFWKPGQPDGYSDDCVTVHNRGNWNETWYGYPCNAQQWSICEKPAI